MKQFFLAAALMCLLLPARAVEPTLISIETDHTQLILTVDAAGNLRTRHYGARIADPAPFLLMETGMHLENGAGPMTYPTTGGKFIGAPALHVRYADGNHNTELYYVGHKCMEHLGGVPKLTEIILRDPVTGLEVKLCYEAFPKQDIIRTWAEICNNGKKPVELLDYASLQGKLCPASEYKGRI